LAEDIGAVVSRRSSVVGDGRRTLQRVLTTAG
jgi:hypothetical protein